MIQIETERDIERLRKVAILQDMELKRLRKRLEEVIRALAAANGKSEIEALQLQFGSLQRSLNRAMDKKDSLGQGSERRGKGKKGKTKKPKGSERTPQPKLPIEETIINLDEADQVCPECGGVLSPIPEQFEESEED